MKQQILNLKKKLLLVELPEGSDSPIMVRRNVLRYWNEKKETAEYLSLKGEHKQVGKLTDITEEQFQNWVEKFYNGAVRDYREGSFDPADDLANFFLTAEESFFSYLEAHGIYFSNPLGKKPFVSVFDINPDSVVRKEYYKWEEAEQKVWNKDLIYVFEII